MGGEKMSYLAKLKQHKPFDIPDDTLEVLFYELGEVSKCVHHIRNFPLEKVGYRGYLLTAIADAYAQLITLAQWYDFSLVEVQHLAWERFVEKMETTFPLEGRQ